MLTRMTMAASGGNAMVMRKKRMRMATMLPAGPYCSYSLVAVPAQTTTAALLVAMVDAVWSRWLESSVVEGGG